MDDSGKDVIVPWVLSKEFGTTNDKKASQTREPQVLNRYYHMFAKGELRGLVDEAARDLELQVGSPISNRALPLAQGVEIVQEGWERSNHYVELRCWENRH